MSRSISSRRLRSGLTRECLPAGEDLWERVGPAWSNLLHATDEPSAFLSATWIGTWVESVSAAGGAEALVWRDVNGVPVGCVILVRASGRLGPSVVSRAFVNSPGRFAMPEHNDVLALPEWRGAVLDDLVEVLVSGGSDEVVLVGVRERLFDELRARWPERWWNGHASESPYIDLARVRNAGGDYLSLLSSNTRAQIRRSIRLYEVARGPVTISVAKGPDERSAALDDLIRLHESVWAGRGETGAFEPEVRRFHEVLVERAGRDYGLGAVRDLRVDLARVRAGDETIGILYHLVRAGRVHFLQSGFRYEDDGRLKPGLVTHCLSVGFCAGSGLDEYDFLGGEPASVRYKRSLATGTRTLYWAQLAAPTVKMRAVEGARRAKRVLKANWTRLKVRHP